MTAPKNILIVTQDFPPETGGIQVYLFELARHFHKRGHQVTVVCPGSARTPSPLPPEVRVVRVSIHSSWLFAALWFRLPGMLRRDGFTHVLYAQWQAVLSEVFIPRRAKKHRSLCLIHGRETLRSVFGPLHFPLCRLAFRRVDIALPNSHAVLELTRKAGRPACPMHLVHPAVDPELFRPSDPTPLRKLYGINGGPVIFSMARMVKRKNMAAVLDAFAVIRRAFPDAWLVLAGEGPERAPLGLLAQRLGCSDRVVFPGVIRHEPFIRAHGASLYSIADVFVLPCLGSKRDVEGFGIVYLEAGACEVPVIGTRTGGIPDAVQDGVTGLLVPPEDAGTLVDALLQVLENKEEARRMGRASRQRILTKFTWESTGDKVLSLM